MKIKKLSKKLLSVALCAAMVGSCAAVLPAVTQGGGSIVASAVEATPASSFSYKESNGEIEITGFKGTETEVIIPSEIDGKPVTSIGGYAFLNCTQLTSIEIPDSVTYIEVGAFNCCTGLTSITIPDSVTSIGSAAFSYCTGLTSINIPDSVKSISNQAFSDCDGLTSVTIPDSVTSIGLSAFSRCTGLKSVTIGNSVTSIGYKAFSGCTGLTSINIPDSVTSIGGSAFSDCTGLTSITIPDSVTRIDGTFYGCTGLTSITIPDSVTIIGNESFFGCTGLKSATIGNSVTSIGYKAFSGCTGLTSVTIGNSVTSIGFQAFYNCNGLTSITIPDSVTSIDINAFSGCTGLTSIEIPDSVTSIGDWAFTGCKGLMIYGVKDSAAEKYAIDNGIPFVSISDELMNISTVSKTSVPQNTSVFVKGAAVSGAGNYKYAFYYKKSTSGAWQTIGELYGKTTEVSFVPATVAKYLVKVNVKDSTGKIVTKIFEVNSTKPTGNDLVNKSVLDKTTTVKGSPITITGAASGGADGYKYAFYYKKTTSKAFTAIGTEYGDAATATFTPASAAEYNVRINVKDANGTIVTKQYKITSTASAELKNTSTVSATEVAKGTAITLTGAATGGKSPYSYSFYYKKSTSSLWTKIGTEFGSDTAQVFTPAMIAAYIVKITVKDGSGKTADKTFTITSK